MSAGRPIHSLEGQHVVVIGGSSGVGLAVASQARAEGAQVTIMARNAERLASAIKQIPGISSRIVDLSDLQGIDQCFSSLGRIDHLVISAGTLSFAALSASTPADWRAVLEERIIGPLVAIKAASPHIARSIVLFSGSIAHRPFPGSCVLAAAAGGIESAVRELALELAPIRVNAVSPGLLDTPMTEKFLGANKSQVFEDTLARLPARRIGTSDDAADVALFLMRNAYVTGTIIGVDGGSRLI